MHSQGNTRHAYIRISLSFIDEQPDWLDPQLVGQMLHRSQRQVAFAPFDTAEIGAMDTKDIREGLLGVAALQPDSTQVAPHDPL
jgi:hypothetical protein